MQWKRPKNTDKYYWTQHVQEKMHYYGLSEQKVLGVIRKPQRIETGIVENTVAVMIPVSVKTTTGKPVSKFSKWRINFDNEETGGKTWSQEIWVMYQLRDSGASSKFQVSSSKTEEKNKKSKIENLKLKISNLANHKICIISAWRYPGVSPEKNPIPEEILREIEALNSLK